jgi:hypothetical protein
MTIPIVTMALAGPAAAFDDEDFCAAAKQLARASEADVGTWIDRMTRNGGVRVACETRVVEFLRFTYEMPSTTDSAWKARAAQGWNSARCASPLWREAVLNGWKVTLSIWSARGDRFSFEAACK